jgi:ribonuclease HIII
MTIKETAFAFITKTKLILEKNNLSPTDILEKEYNFEVSVKSNGTNIKVLIYFGKKGVRTILQGDEKSELYHKIQNLILDEPKLDFRDPKIVEPEQYVGTDECGKGDFFGPLVVGAAYVDKQSLKELRAIGVRDSKDLNENQIHYLAYEIKKIIAAKFNVVRITPHKYNELYPKFANLNKLLNWAHSKALENLLNDTKCKYVITDKFSNHDLQISSSKEFSDVEFVQIEKGEKYIGVAAASILARENFNNWFNDQAKKGLLLPKGSSGNVELIASKLLQKIGENKLEEIAKLHFKTFSKIKR